jgi:hypothetical protein
MKVREAIEAGLSIENGKKKKGKLNRLNSWMKRWPDRPGNVRADKGQPRGRNIYKDIHIPWDTLGPREAYYIQMLPAYKQQRIYAWIRDQGTKHGRSIHLETKQVGETLFIKLTGKSTTTPTRGVA